MNLGKYINRLIREHDIVIIPGFGAFISEYKPSEINESTGDITPPSKKISLDRKIKNNDGLLATEIAFREKVSTQEALKIIEKEVDDILYRLDKREKVILDNTGAIFFDETGKIQFESTNDANLLSDSFGLESASLFVEIENADKQEEESAEDEINDEIPEEFPANEPDNSGEPVTETSSPVSAGPENQDPDKHSGGKKMGWLWLLIIFIILLGAAIFAWNYFIDKTPPSTEIIAEPPADNEYRESDPATDIQKIAPADSLKADSAKISLTDTLTSEQKVDTTGFVTPDPSKYYLVGGSFADPENAEKYLQQMKAKGFKPFRLGKHGSFYIIALETYNNEIEAYGTQYNFLDKYPDSGVWVFIPESEQKN